MAAGAFSPGVGVSAQALAHFQFVSVTVVASIRVLDIQTLECTLRNNNNKASDSNTRFLFV